MSMIFDKAVLTRCFCLPAESRKRERDMLGWFLSSFPAEERRAVGMRAPTTPNEMAVALECALATWDMGRSERWDPGQDFRRDQFRQPTTTLGTP